MMIHYPMCNNRILPIEYLEVEYLESTGTLYIDTEYIITKDTYFDIKYMRISLSSIQSVFGYRSVNSPSAVGDMVFFFIYPDGKIGVRYGYEVQNSSNSYSGICNLISNGTSVRLNNELIILNISYSNSYSPKKAYLFTTNTDGYANSDIVNFTGRIYHCIILESGILKRHFIPCYRKSDNKPGLFDIVEQKFYINKGSGEFLVGGFHYDYEVEYLEGSGTQYIDTGILGTSITRFFIKGTCREFDLNTNAQLIGGNQQSSSSFFGVRRFSKNDSAWYCRDINNNSLGNPYIPSIIDATINSSTSQTGTLEYGNTTLNFYSFSDSWGFPNENLLIFGGYTSRRSPSARCYFLKLYTTNGLVRDFIPVVKNGIGYMYDKVSGQLFGNAGTGNFIVGPMVDKAPFVDMGLPSGVKWATCNIDVTQPDGFAASPYQYGCSFFSWGNIDGHNPTSNSSFSPWNWGGINQAEPWYDGQVYGGTPGNTLTGNIAVGEAFDAARANLGAPWRMPTNTEYGELFSNIDYLNADGTVKDSSVTNKLSTVNGIVGIWIQSKINGARLFFSCSGYGNGTSRNNRGSYGDYWSSTWNSARYARYLYFGSGGVYPQNNGNRYNGFAVRAVLDSTPTPSYVNIGYSYGIEGQYDKNIYTESDGSKWIRIFHHNDPTSNSVFSSSDTFTTGIYKDENRWFDMAKCNEVSKWELMVKLKTTSSASEQKFRWILYVNPMTGTFNNVAYDKIKRIEWVGNSFKGGLYRLNNSNTYLSLNNANSSNWFGAVGAKATHQGGIPGFGSSCAITTGYMDVYLRIDNGCPNYSGCYKYDGTSYLITYYEWKPTTYSISVWVKDYIEGTILRNDTKYSPVIDIDGSNLRMFHWKDSTNTAMITKSVSSCLTSGWNHLVMTYDGTTIKGYVNNVSIGSIAATSPYCIGKLFIGKTPENVDANFPNFNGLMSDLRIYDYALSDNEIKQLYDMKQ